MLSNRSAPQPQHVGQRRRSAGQDHGLAGQEEHPAGSFGFAFKWVLLNRKHHAGNIGICLTFAIVMSNWTIELPLQSPLGCILLTTCVGSMSLFTFVNPPKSFQA